MSIYKVIKFGGNKDNYTMYVRDENKIKKYRALNDRNTIWHYNITKIED